MRTSNLLFAVPALALLVGAPLAASGQKAGAITITGPWTRQTAPGQANGGGFLVVTNAGRQPDRLIGGSTPAAAKVEIHSMSMDGGVMRMRPVPGGVPVAPGGKLELKPGGYHLMLIGLKSPLKLGSTVPLTLRFQRAGTVTVQLKVESITHGTGTGHDHH